MSVVRAKEVLNVTTVSNTCLKNEDMSLGAKGLLTLMLSLPPDMDFTINELVEICKEGRRSVTTSMSELERHGYIKITKMSTKKGNNKISYIYEVYKEPLFNYVKGE